MTPEEIFEEFSSYDIPSQSDKKRVMKNLRNSLIKNGMDENEADEKTEEWGEVNWSHDEWKEYYGVDSDSDLEDAMESYWDD